MKLLVKTALAGVLALAAGTTAQANKSNDTIVWTTASEVGTADLYYISQREVFITTLNMCDSLLHYDSITHKSEPLLAESYKLVDPETIEFKLREGVKFWDGRDFGAKDVAYTLNHISRPDSGVLNREAVSWIKNVEVTGPYEVRIHTNGPTPAGLAYLTDTTPIYPDGHYDDAPTITGSGGKEIRDYGAVMPVCTGPYKLAEFVPGKTFTLVKNPNYFEGGPKGQPHIGKLVFKTIPDVDSQMAALMTQKVDWIWSVPPQDVEILGKDPKLAIKSASTLRMSFLSLDSAGRSGENPLQNLKVRQAIAHAIDRAAIAHNLVGPGAKVLKSMCSPQQAMCVGDVPQYDYDPALAKKLLAEAGYPDGLDIEFHAYFDRPYTEAVMNYLRAVGIRTNLRFLTWPAIQPLLAKGSVTFSHLTWGSNSVMDASASTGHYFKFGADDYARDEQVRDWLDTADRTMDQAERQDLYRKALTRIAEQAYFVPIFLYTRIYAFNSDIDYVVTPDELAHFYRSKWK